MKGIEKETALSKPIIRYVKMIRGDLIRVNAGSIQKGNYRIQLAPEGTLDHIGYLPGGYYLEIETKLPYNRLSEKQREKIDQVNKAGGLAFCAKSLDDVIITINQWLKEKKA